jgi:hypothetical protein
MSVGFGTHACSSIPSLDFDKALLGFARKHDYAAITPS